MTLFLMLNKLYYYNNQPLQILLIGKPKSGKSTITSLLAKKYDIHHI